MKYFTLVAFSSFLFFSCSKNDIIDIPEEEIEINEEVVSTRSSCHGFFWGFKIPQYCAGWDSWRIEYSYTSGFTNTETPPHSIYGSVNYNHSWGACGFVNQTNYRYSYKLFLTGDKVDCGSPVLSQTGSYYHNE